MKPYCAGLARMRRCSVIAIVVAWQLLQTPAWCQRPVEEAVQPRSIADEPKFIDPAELVDRRLSTPAKITFVESPLSEVAHWVQDQTGLNVVLNEHSLGDVYVLASDPVSDELDNDPIYLLLDRLERLRVTWHLADGVLTLDGHNDESGIYTTQHNVGDLLDMGYKSEPLTSAVQAILDADRSRSVEYSSSIVLLGDVLFVRQTARGQRKLAGLLGALRKPARRIMVDDPSKHMPMRAALQRSTTISVKDKSLSAVCEELATSTGIDIRLDRLALKTAKISERAPVTLDIRDQPVATVLNLLASQQRLTWLLRDGVLWITTGEVAVAGGKIAVFDVRDLCKDLDECAALQEAIEQQSNPDSWESSEGYGTIVFPIAGIMIVYQTEDRLDSLLQLLEDYRSALRSSKRRVSPEDDPEVVETKFYRMPTAVAKELAVALPSMLEVDTWRNKGRPEAPGTIRILKSWDRMPDCKSSTNSSESSAALRAATAYSVLVIDQKRRVHKAIPPLLQRLEHGDTPFETGGMGGMGGGFGGGMFSVTTDVGSASKTRMIRQSTNDEIDDN